jgi:hypothetical protein
VVTDAIIDETGKVRHPVVTEGFEPLMVYATLHTLRDWRFRPARLAGKPVAVYYTLTTRFDIEGPCRGA